MSNSTVNMSAGMLYKRLLNYVKSYWPIAIVTVCSMVVFSLSEASFAALMQPLIDGTFVDQDKETIKLIPLFLIGLALIRGIANFLTSYSLGWIARKVIQQLRAEMHDKLIRLPASFFDKNTSGQLMSKLLYDVEQVASAATEAVLTLFRDSLTIIALLAWMVYLNGMLSLIILLTVPFIGSLVYFISSRFRRISKSIQGSMGNVSHVSSEIINGHREVKIFGSQGIERERFSKINKYNRNQYMKRIVTDAISQPVVQIIAICGLAGVIYLATRPEMLSEISAGTFISFATAMFMILTPLKRLTKVNSKLQAGIAAAESIFALIDEPTEPDEGEIEIQRSQGHIIYRDVSFSYSEEGTKVLDKINIEIKPGQTVAFVGHSGSGKTTLATLLPRFYNPTEGQILLDNIDTQQLTLESLRKQISLVNQQVVLFNDTIANNIRYGLSQDISENKVIEAAKAAHAWEFIQRLPEGLNTMIGENGVLLSGGQRQRLAIARALLHDSPILILDEATSALDSEAEKHIQAALETIMLHRTTLVIAHRLSTIEKADLIIVMHNGHIIESGTHQELIDKGQHYADLHKLQFQS